MFFSIMINAADQIYSILEILRFEWVPDGLILHVCIYLLNRRKQKKEKRSLEYQVFVFPHFLLLLRLIWNMLCPPRIFYCKYLQSVSIMCLKLQFTSMWSWLLLKFNFFALTPCPTFSNLKKLLYSSRFSTIGLVCG